MSINKIRFLIIFLVLTLLNIKQIANGHFGFLWSEFILALVIELAISFFTRKKTEWCKTLKKKKSIAWKLFGAWFIDYLIILFTPIIILILIFVLGGDFNENIKLEDSSSGLDMNKFALVYFSIYGIFSILYGLLSYFFKNFVGCKIAGVKLDKNNKTINLFDYLIKSIFTFLLSFIWPLHLFFIIMNKGYKDLISDFTGVKYKSSKQ